MGLHQILRDPATARIHKPEIELSGHVPLVSGPLIPERCLGQILGRSYSDVVNEAELVLRIGVALIRVLVYLRELARSYSARRLNSFEKIGLAEEVQLQQREMLIEVASRAHSAVQTRRTKPSFREMHTSHPPLCVLVPSRKNPDENAHWARPMRAPFSAAL